MAVDCDEEPAVGEDAVGESGRGAGETEFALVRYGDGAGADVWGGAGVGGGGGDAVDCVLAASGEPGLG